MNLTKNEKIKRAVAWWFDIKEIDYEKIILGNPEKVEEAFKKSVEELGGDLSLTTVEWLTPNRCLELYDSREYTFFYLDPPYFVESEEGDTKTCHYNYAEYTMDDFKKMLDTLENDFKGMFLLSGFPTKLLNEYVERNGWNYLEITKKSSAHKQTLGKSNTKEKIEILCWNYDIE